MGSEGPYLGPGSESGRSSRLQKNDPARGRWLYNHSTTIGAGLVAILVAKKKAPARAGANIREATGGFEPPIGVLQTPVLALSEQRWDTARTRHHVDTVSPRAGEKRSCPGPQAKARSPSAKTAVGSDGCS